MTIINNIDIMEVIFMSEIQLNININDTYFDNFINILSEIIKDYTYFNQDETDKQLNTNLKEE